MIGRMPEFRLLGRPDLFKFLGGTAQDICHFEVSLRICAVFPDHAQVDATKMGHSFVSRPDIVAEY